MAKAHYTDGMPALEAFGGAVAREEHKHQVDVTFTNLQLQQCFSCGNVGSLKYFGMRMQGTKVRDQPYCSKCRASTACRPDAPPRKTLVWRLGNQRMQLFGQTTYTWFENPDVKDDVDYYPDMVLMHPRVEKSGHSAVNMHRGSASQVLHVDVRQGPHAGNTYVLLRPPNMVDAHMQWFLGLFCENPDDSQGHALHVVSVGTGTQFPVEREGDVVIDDIVRRHFGFLPTVIGGRKTDADEYWFNHHLLGRDWTVLEDIDKKRRTKGKK